ncbi:MAG: M17 family peptidase N-terminal domain-containing protein [Candidatus Acidiferrum sp.]
MVKKLFVGRPLAWPLIFLTTGALLAVCGLPKRGIAQAEGGEPFGSVATGEAASRTAGQSVQRKPTEFPIAKTPIPTRVMVESPAETNTALQIICLFESAPQNALHGSLAEANEKLKGLLDAIRRPTLFRGELGETILISPPAGSFGARRLLIVGLGDSETFTPQRMELVGTIAYRESARLRVANPFFAPTVLDGGVTKYTTGQVAEEFYAGFLRAARTEKTLRGAGASPGQMVQSLTYLAGGSHATDTRQGIERALAD